MRIRSFTLLLLASVTFAASALAAPVTYTEDGLTKVRQPAVDPKFANPGWTAELEKQFWQHAAVYIKAAAGSTDSRTTGEGEKWSYPIQMGNYLSGNRDAALAILQANDVDADTDHAHTLGIDWYWSFTIKGQIRKYFQFGDALDPAYLKRMKESAKLWTAEDPRPNFELILLMEDPNDQVRQYAFEAMRKSKAELEKNWAGKVGEDFRAWAAKAPPDRASAATAIGEIIAKYQGQDFGHDLAKWRQWWKDFADHDWVVLEEVERIMNIKTLPRYDHGVPGAIGSDFSPHARSFWVDARNTDNLRAMRETSVYLMAEETGNELTRLIYKQRIKRFVVACYHIGMGEWDSENYLAHTTMPYHNLYDFAKDPEVKLLAKAFLDWVYTANAMKYYRGGFGGPTKRDYGGASVVFGSSPAQAMWLFASDCPLTPPRPEADLIHAVLSTYRPPALVVALARKDFKKPVEMFDTKPQYSNWFPGADAAPEFFETMFYADSYYLGTCVSAGASGDVGPFKLLAKNTQRGVDYFLANTGKKLNSKNAGDQIAQYRNLCVFLNGKGNAFSFQVPESTKRTFDHGIWFIQMEGATLAVRLISLAEPAKDGPAPKGKDDSIYSAKSTGGALSGFALEIATPAEARDLPAFIKNIQSAGKLELAGDHVTFLGSNGNKLEVTFNRQNDLPQVTRDGIARDWNKQLAMYQPVDSDGPVVQGWKTGSLTIKAAGHTFVESVDKDGKVTFKYE